MKIVKIRGKKKKRERDCEKKKEEKREIARMKRRGG
jgi:hypothetical protein